MSDIDTAAVDSLKVLDPKRPIREADIAAQPPDVRFRGRADIVTRRCIYHLRAVLLLLSSSPRGIFMPPPE